jgi:hypothetical protein
MATTFQLRVWTRYYAPAADVDRARTEGSVLDDSSPSLLPFDHWEHTGELQDTPDGSRYIDHIVFTPGGPVQKLVAIATQRAFQRRHQRAANHLPADARTVGVAVLRVVHRDEDDLDEDS